MISFTTADFQQAKANHLQFKRRLRTILYDELPENESTTVLSQYACSMGKWIYGHALIEYEAIPEVHELERVHAAIHVVARKLVSRYQQGFVEEARQGLVEMEQIADRLVELLHLVEEKVTVSASAPVAPAEEPETTGLTALLEKNELLDVRIRQQLAQGGETFKAIDNERQVLHNFFMQAPAAHCILRGPNHVFELTNTAFLELIGREAILGKTVREVLPELEGQGFLGLLDLVFTTGEPYAGKETPVVLVDGQGGTKTIFVNFIYQTIKDRHGKSEGVLVFAYEVTGEVTARKIIEESELRFRSLIREAPVAMLVYTGPDMVMQEANEKMLDIFGRGDAVLGKPLLEAVPELAGTALPEQYRQVMATGETHHEYGQRILLVKNGEQYWGYYDYTYKALRDDKGLVYGVICTAIDVSAQVMTRHKLEEIEESLQGAIELADLGTWSIDLATGVLDYSARLRGWFGIGPDEIITVKRGYQPIRESDRALIKAAITRATTPGADGVYDVEYVVDNAGTGKNRLLHAQGKTSYNDQGQAVRIRGTVQDITEQRAIQAALENQVQERTEELASINEELLAANEELIESNDLLIRSNENLQKFAYVASHDLQEPLRKIQQFSDLMRINYQSPSPEAAHYLDRIQSSASRMSSLIRDLLTFSRISTQRDTSNRVALSQIIQEVQIDLELVIAETGAVITVAPLPMIAGDASQLGQLFQNLLSNALKFHRPSVAPVIEISFRTVPARALPPSVKPGRTSPVYYQIDVADNGIGFDEKYLDRIFEVFQRLYSKDEFAGTGIGLAICEKVVANHGGAITATSQPNRRTTFHIYLPAPDNV